MNEKPTGCSASAVAVHVPFEAGGRERGAVGRTPLPLPPWSGFSFITPYGPRQLPQHATGAGGGAMPATGSVMPRTDTKAGAALVSGGQRGL